jgi:zinc transporter 1/2/3
MADSSLNLRIAAVFIIFTASIMGVGLPFCILHLYGPEGGDTKEVPLFKCMKSGAAGVMLGIALMHLLVDANTTLSQVVGQYSLAYAMTCLGVVINLAMEQCALLFIEMQAEARKLKLTCATQKGVARKHEERSNSHSSSSVGSCSTTQSRHGQVHNESCGFVSCGHSDGTEAMTLQVNQGHNSLGFAPGTDDQIDQDICAIQEMSSADSELISGLIASNEWRDIILLYSLELSISVHSVIIGVDIGLLTGRENMTALVTLICAISFHQLMEGIGLGTNMLSSKYSMGSMKVLAFITVFALTCSVGIIIGICTASSTESSGQLFAKGIANSLAAGSLLYISLAEMVPNYFTAADLTNRPRMKLLMIASFSFGVIVMAVLAYWA